MSSTRAACPLTTTALALLALAIIPAPPAAGQAIPRELALGEALEIARERSPDYRQQENVLERASIDRRLAFQTTFLPQINSGITLEGRRFRSYTAENFDGVPLEKPYSTEGESSRTSQGVGLSMTLFSGESFMQYRAARANTEATETRIDAQRTTLRVGISRRFYGVVQADESVALERRLLERARTDLDATEKRFDLGLLDRESVSGAQIALLRREHSVDRAIGNARKARLDLLEAMGIEGEYDFDPVGDIPKPFDPMVLDAEALVHLAVTTSPRIRSAEAQVDMAVASSRAASGSRLPTVRASASYGRASSSEGYDSFFVLNPPNSDYNLALTLQIPVPFLRYTENANIARVRINAEDARENLSRERNALEKEVKRLIIDLGSAFGEIRLQERQVELMQERLMFLEERARVGQPIEYLALETARDEAANAERAVLTSRIAFQNLVLELEQVVGVRVGPPIFDSGP